MQGRKNCDKASITKHAGILLDRLLQNLQIAFQGSWMLYSMRNNCRFSDRQLRRPDFCWVLHWGSIYSWTGRRSLNYRWRSDRIDVWQIRLGWGQRLRFTHDGRPVAFRLRKNSQSWLIDLNGSPTSFAFCLAGQGRCCLTFRVPFCTR